MTRQTWNPETHPYRVTWVVRAGPQLYGWNTHTRTFETEAQAVESMNRPFGPGVKEAYVCLFLGTRWKLLHRRKRRTKKQRPPASSDQP